MRILNFKAKDDIKLSNLVCAKEVIVPEAKLSGLLNKWQSQGKVFKMQYYFFFLMAEPSHPFPQSSHLHKIGFSCHSQLITISCSKFFPHSVLIQFYHNAEFMSNSAL